MLMLMRLQFVDETHVLMVGHETDFLALAPLRKIEARLRCQLANGRFFVIADGKQEPREPFPRDAEHDVRLVFTGVAPTRDCRDVRVETFS